MYIKKRQLQSDTEKLKDLKVGKKRDNIYIVTQVKPDILEYEVKWALGSITTNNDRRGDGIPAELFENPKE